MIKTLLPVFRSLLFLALLYEPIISQSQCGSNPPNAVATPPLQTICSGASITPIVLSSNNPAATFNWTRDNTAAVTGIPASGSGNISGVLTNTTNAPVTVKFTITPQTSQLINETFNTVLPAGWAQQNLSSPVGTQPSWYAGTSFPPYSPTGYIAVNQNSTTTGNFASNWLFTPQILMKNGDQFSFYTKSTWAGDDMQVRISFNGPSVNVGSSNTSVGDFQTLLVHINPGAVFLYPNIWTLISVPIMGFPAGTFSGRIAFRYFSYNSGGSAELGIDDVVFTSIGSTCTGQSISATVIVNPSPTVSITSDIPPPIGPGQVMTLTANTSPTGGTFVWRKDGVVIFGATSNTLTGITVTETGNYSVTYTDPNGCVNTSSNFNVFARPGEGLFIHPNPNNGDFRVTFYNTTAHEEVSITVSDPQGKIVLRNKITTGVLPYDKIEVDLKNSNTNGIYLVEVRNSKGVRIGSGIVNIAK